MSFPRYPAYKDSGVEWVGDVPDHWETKPLKYLASHNDEVLPESTHPDFEFRYVEISDVDETHGVTNVQPVVFQKSPSRARRIARTGDIIISTVRTYLKAIARIDLSLSGVVVSTGFAVLRPQKGVDAEFLAYAVKAPCFLDKVVAYSVGISYPAINSSDLVKLRLPLPPLAEQCAIAAFLDAETARIDALIAKQAALVALLQEKRRALISHAVTKGLDPAAPMRDSGVAWLGAVPAGWEVKRLKYCLLSLDQGWSPQCENRPAEGNEWGILKVGCVNGNTFDPTENKALPDDLEPIESLIVCLGDVLISRANTRELVGSAAVVSQDHPNLLLCDKLYRLRIDPKQSTPEYVTLILRTPMVRVQMEVDATGASQSMQNISQSTIRNLVFVFPPVPEQIVLLNQITSETAQIDTLIAKAEAFSAVLREHRTALIAAAVTGQIDVRGIGC